MTIDDDLPALRVKCAGGAAAQTLALIDAIYVSLRTNRQFMLDYYPSGTGTYWPFEIEPLLKRHERPDSFSLSRGHTGSGTDQATGKVDPSHPINSKKLSVETLYLLIRKFKLDRFLLGLRGEIPISTSKKQLDKVTRKTRSISGGYLPVQS